MAESNRRLDLGVGLLFLAGFGWSLWNSLEVVTENPVSITGAVTIVGGATMLLGGGALVLAGLTDRISIAGRTLESWQFRSVGFVSIGAYMLVTGLSLGLLSTVGVLCLLAGVGFIGAGLVRLQTGRSGKATLSVDWLNWLQ